MPGARHAAVLATLAAMFATFSGCSGKTNTQGEIVVAIQTDLSLPKDVSAVRIQITTLGVVRFDNTYPVGPDPSMRIPATLGLLPGENPNSPVRIRVVGFKKELQPRILREVITTVPPSRVVTLRVPLQWLSDGSAKADPIAGATDPFAFQNACADGQTDLGGDCGDAKVDSSALPDYAPADVFGGGDENGAGGTCFDTQPCMQGGVATPITVQADGSCEASAPSGGDPANVNVAIALGAGGDGICADASGAAPCFVPLDRVDSTSNLGWSAGTDVVKPSEPGPSDAGTPPPPDAGAKLKSGTGEPSLNTPFSSIHLPRAVCRKLAASKGTLVVSQSCPSKLQQNPTCGPWSSVQGNGGGGPGGQKDGGGAHPDASDLDGGPCVNTQTDPNNCGQCGHSCGDPRSTCSNGHCDAITLASGFDHVGSIALETDHVYFANGYAATGGSIQSVLKTGGAPVAIATNLSYPGGVSTEGVNVFFTSYGSPPNGFVYMATTDPANPQSLAPGQNYPLATVARGGFVYWITGAGGTVSRVAESGGGIVPIYSGAARTSGSVAVDGTYVYWTEYDLGTVQRALLDGSAGPTQLTSGLSHPLAIAVDGSGVYVATDTEVDKVPLNGGVANPIATSIHPGAIAIDSLGLYIVDTMTGAILRGSNAGGAPVLPLTVAPNANSIAVDADWVYWSTWTNGTVQRIGIK